MSDNKNLGAYIASVVAQVARENSQATENKLINLIKQHVAGNALKMPNFGNPVYLGGEVVLDPGGTDSIVMKVSASRDLQILSMSISQDGTPADRLDPWQSDVRLRSYRFTSMLKDLEYEQIVDGEIMLGDLFGRDDDESVIDIVKASQDITMEFRNTDPNYSHRVNVSIKCGFWPPILYGLKQITQENLYDLRPEQ